MLHEREGECNDERERRFGVRPTIILQALSSMLSSHVFGSDALGWNKRHAPKINSHHDTKI